MEISSNNAASSWPPAILSQVNASQIIDECELMELLPQQRGQGKQFVAVVEMAALIFQGNLQHAKHLWRRSAENQQQQQQPLLHDWWKVAAGMLQNDAEQIWIGLQHILEHHPAPMNGYAAAVATAYRQRLLNKVVGNNMALAAMPPLSGLLHFASAQELQQFVVGMDATNNAIPTGFVDEKASILQVVSFLETAKMMQQAASAAKATTISGKKVDPEILA